MAIPNPSSPDSRRQVLDEREANRRRSLPYAAYHFSTSGASVAVATSLTHPLGVESSPVQASKRNLAKRLRIGIAAAAP